MCVPLGRFYMRYQTVEDGKFCVHTFQIWYQVKRWCTKVFFLLQMSVLKWSLQSHICLLPGMDTSQPTHLGSALFRFGHAFCAFIIYLYAYDIQDLWRVVMNGVDVSLQRAASGNVVGRLLTSHNRIACIGICRPSLTGSSILVFPEQTRNPIQLHWILQHLYHHIPYSIISFTPITQLLHSTESSSPFSFHSIRYSYSLTCHYYLIWPSPSTIKTPFFPASQSPSSPFSLQFIYIPQYLSKPHNEE